MREVYPPRDIRPFVMYCVNGKPRSSLLIESTESMIIIESTDSMIIILENATALGSRIPPHTVLLQVNENTPVKLKIIFAILEWRAFTE